MVNKSISVNYHDLKVKTKLKVHLDEEKMGDERKIVEKRGDRIFSPAWHERKWENKEKEWVSTHFPPNFSLHEGFGEKIVPCTPRQYFKNILTF